MVLLLDMCLFFACLAAEEAIVEFQDWDAFGFLFLFLVMQPTDGVIKSFRFLEIFNYVTDVSH
jgi:hypothetical protein